MISDDGEQLGIMAVNDALVLAEERGLDLVEMAATAEPAHEGAQQARAQVYWHRRAAERSLMSKGVFAAAARESEAAVGIEVVSDRFGTNLRGTLR